MVKQCAKADGRHNTIDAANIVLRGPVSTFNIALKEEPCICLG
jgi:hypothetical protein